MIYDDRKLLIQFLTEVEVYSNCVDAAELLLYGCKGYRDMTDKELADLADEEISNNTVKCKETGDYYEHADDVSLSIDKVMLIIKEFNFNVEIEKLLK